MSSPDTPPTHASSASSASTPVQPPLGSFTPVTHERPPASSAHPIASSTSYTRPPLPRPPPIPTPARSNRLVTGSLVALVTVFFVFPFGYITYHNNKSDRKGHYGGAEPMGRTAVIRGAYVNTGSRDVGYDDEFYKRNAEVVRQLSEAQRGGSAVVSDNTKR